MNKRSGPTGFCIFLFCFMGVAPAFATDQRIRECERAFFSSPSPSSLVSYVSELQHHQLHSLAIQTILNGVGRDEILSSSESQQEIRERLSKSVQRFQTNGEIVFARLVEDPIQNQGFPQKIARLIRLPSPTGGMRFAFEWVDSMNGKVLKEKLIHLPFEFSLSRGTHPLYFAISPSGRFAAIRGLDQIWVDSISERQDERGGVVFPCSPHSELFSFAEMVRFAENADILLYNNYSQLRAFSFEGTNQPLVWGDDSVVEAVVVEGVAVAPAEKLKLIQTQNGYEAHTTNGRKHFIHSLDASFQRTAKEIGVVPYEELPPFINVLLPTVGRPTEVYITPATSFLPSYFSEHSLSQSHSAKQEYMRIDTWLPLFRAQASDDSLQRGVLWGETIESSEEQRISVSLPF